MKLIGRNSSPYTRRVAIALQLYGLTHEHQKLIPFGEGKDFLRSINPVTRVPVLQLPDGESLVESHNILDYLDSLVADNERLIPASGYRRRKVLNTMAIACAALDKLVAVLYEFQFRPREMVYEPWIDQCEQQVRDGFYWLNSHLKSDRFLEGQLTQADITTAVFWKFASVKRPGIFERDNCKQLQRLSEELEQTDAFRLTRPEGPMPQSMKLPTN